jgi:phosphatidylglycerol:prolipoprotein diacylglycerol transferase
MPGTFMRASAIIPPGMFLSHPPTTSAPSIAWPFTEVLDRVGDHFARHQRVLHRLGPHADAVGHRSESRTPAAWRPAASSAAIARSTSGWIPALQGFIVEWPFATPTIGFSKSPSLKPTAAQHRPVRRARDALRDQSAPAVVCHARFLQSLESNLTVLVHPNFDPVAFSLGPLAVRWYGLMYLAGFGRRLVARRAANRARAFSRHPAQFDDLLFCSIVGVIVGGRLGYVLFYKAAYYLAHPLEIFAVWQGGMSFHGGFLGRADRDGVRRAAPQPALAGRDGLHRAALSDSASRTGRLGNFINGELWGRASDVPWAMVFRGGGGRCAPSFAALPDGARRNRALRDPVVVLVEAAPGAGQVSAVFLIGLRGVSLHRRIRARARRVPRLPRARPDDGAVAQPADDRGRNRAFRLEPKQA